MRKNSEKVGKIKFIIIIVLVVLLWSADGIFEIVGLSMEKGKIQKYSISTWSATEDIVREYVGEDVFTRGSEVTQYFSTREGNQFLLYIDVESLKSGKSLVRVALIGFGNGKISTGSSVRLFCEYNVKYELDIETKEVSNKKIGDLVLSNINLGIVANEQTKFDSGMYFTKESLYSWFNFNEILVYAPDITYQDAKKQYKHSSENWVMNGRKDEKYIKMNYDQQYGLKKNKTEELFFFEINVFFEANEGSVTKRASFDIDKAGVKVASGEFMEVHI